MHRFPNDPARRRVWVDFVRRGRNRDWTPAKRSLICSRHFAPDCYRAGNHRYLVDFGFELTKKQYLEPEAVPTLYAASAKHRDASPATELTCKRLCCESFGSFSLHASTEVLPALQPAAQPSWRNVLVTFNWTGKMPHKRQSSLSSFFLPNSKRPSS
ncbi:hypothetical protein HPB52_004355 [Rhipicephalus sanguineus]|uniref:THAP-type domain-containing protein n=1 Tax=Rhipicephalus sanguineus TaxID=34632 RepID=A0A9D4PBP7_RHISA|nr:hypothetical protein HPB52_004355 [Rhipicephalus sanguineus]